MLSGVVSCRVVSRRVASPTASAQWPFEPYCARTPPLLRARVSQMRARCLPAILAIGLAAACSSSGGGTTVTVLGYTVLITTAPPTSALIGTSIPIAFTATENESDGSSKPASGKSFTVTVTAGGGTVNGTTSTTLTTASDGSVSITWLLGTTAGTQTVRGSVSSTYYLDVNVTATAPITSSVLTGPLRVKVGDTYTYSETARLANGTVVQRPVTWSILVPGTATVTQAGVVVPLQPGPISVVTTIDGVAWFGVITGYDWVPIASGTATGAGLPSDLAVTNFVGTSEFPTLLVGCVGGSFVAGVSFTGIITYNGSVTYSGDNGTIINDTWLESSPGFHTLTYPGLTNLLQKSFALTLATNHIFTFAFGEFLLGGGDQPHVTSWRLTGMSTAIAPSIAACPSNSLVAGAPPSPADLVRQLSGAPRPINPSQVELQRQAARAAAGPTGTGFPTIQPTLRAPEVIPMHILHSAGS